MRVLFGIQLTRLSESTRVRRRSFARYAAMLLLTSVCFGSARGELIESSVTTTTVTGTVLGPNGDPIGGATVHAIYGDGGSESIRLEAKTNSNGHFRFESLKPAGDWYISAKAPRHAPETERANKVSVPRPAEAEPLRIQLAKAEAPAPPFNGTTTTVTGTVLGPDGVPAVDVPVQALSYGKDWRPIRLTEHTNQNGNFGFYSLEPDRDWYFSANDPRFAQEWERERMVALPKPVQEGPLTIQLQEPETLWATVVNEQDDPVSGVKVTMNLEWLGDRADPLQESEQYELRVAKTDAAGRISLIGLRPGRVGLVLDHEDFAQTRVRPLASSGTYRLTMQSGLTLSGIVSAGGKPVEGVTVCVISPAIGLKHYGRQCRFVHTDAQGRFQMDKIADLVKNGETNSHTVAVRFMDQQWTSSVYGVYQSAAGSLPELHIEAVPWPEAKNRNFPKWVEVGKPETAE